MKFLFQNPTARVIAEAISETELRRAARAAGITPEDAKFLLDELLLRLEEGRSSFKSKKGNPLFWARRMLFFLFRTHKKKQGVPLSDFDPQPDENSEKTDGRRENSADYWYVLNNWRADQSLSSTEINLPNAKELAEREGITERQVRNKIRKLKLKAAAMAENGATLEELAEVFNQDNPELCRTRKPKTPQPPKGTKK